MRRTNFFAFATAAILLAPGAAMAQNGAAATEDSRAVTGGGIMIPGWTGKADPGALKVSDAKLTKSGDVMAVTTGPAITYWNPANKATGNYTVSATFNEPKYMNLNDHPHPYGIMIAGNDMDTDKPSYLYCAAYGNGVFIVRGFGSGTPATFQMNGGRGTADSAVHKAPAKDQPVMQEIAIKVSADKVECLINGKSVASYPKSTLVAAGKLKSTDGVYGIRFAHNTEATVTGFKMTKQ